jgi:sugar fermentation stimulation protein A
MKKTFSQLKFNQHLIEGKLIRRYKRFLADVRLTNGKIITCHCPNTGSMKTCIGDNWSVSLSKSDNPARKYPHTWEMVHNGRCWIGINTHLANGIAQEAIENGTITELQGYDIIEREKKYGENSRIDILLRNEKQKCYVEIKNVTLVEDDGFFRFPDSVTSRGLKHLNELRQVVKNGDRAVMLYVIQRNDGTIFKVADHIDPEYAKYLKIAYREGVEILPYLADVTPSEIKIVKKIDFSLD